MKLIIAGVILILIGIALFVVTLINWRKESFIKSFLSGVALVIGILLICSEFGAQIEVSSIQNEGNVQIESSDNTK